MTLVLTILSSMLSLMSPDDNAFGHNENVILDSSTGLLVCVKLEDSVYEKRVLKYFLNNVDFGFLPWTCFGVDLYCFLSVIVTEKGELIVKDLETSTGEFKSELIQGFESVTGYPSYANCKGEKMNVSLTISISFNSRIAFVKLQ